MADTDNIIDALKAGVKRVKAADGSETEFLAPKDAEKAINILNDQAAKAAGTRKRVYKVWTRVGR